MPEWARESLPKEKSKKEKFPFLAKRIGEGGTKKTTNLGGK